MQTSEMDRVIELVGSEAARLGEFLAGLDDAGWSTPSACGEWLVGDVAAHLAQGADTWAGAVTRAVAGDANPPAGQQPLQPGERGSEGTARQAIRLRESRASRENLRAFEDGYRRLDQVLESLKPEDWDKPCYHRRGVVPVGVFVSRRVQELAIHGWDMRSAFDPGAALSEESLDVLVGLVPRWLNAAFGAGPGLPAPVRYRFQAPSPVPVCLDVLVEQDGFSVEESGSDSADVTFRCNTSDFILLIYGRVDLDRAVARGVLEIEGDLQQAKQFTRLFRGV